MLLPTTQEIVRVRRVYRTYISSSQVVDLASRKKISSSSRAAVDVLREGQLLVLRRTPGSHCEPVHLPEFTPAHLGVLEVLLDTGVRDHVLLGKA